MAPSHTQLVIDRLRDLAIDQASDRELLEQYLSRRDQGAFAALVRRYGGLVFRVCQGVLSNRQDAQDAFQATFVVLARSGASIRRRDSLSSWLYGVAHRLACKARSQSLRRREILPANRPASLDPAEDVALRELTAILQEELVRLPDKYRSPLVLCCLEGASRDEAAQRLGWTLAQVKDRLERGRELLRNRLVQRGVLPSAALGATVLAPDTGWAALPVQLANDTARSVLNGALYPPRVAALVQGAVMVQVKLGAVLLTLSLLAGGVGLGIAAWPTGQDAMGDLAHQERTPDAQLGPATDLYGDPLPPGAVARLGTVQLRHAGLAELAFSPDGKTLISGGSDRTIRIWDVATGKLRRTVRLQGEIGNATSTALSPDGKVFASHDDKTLVVWDAETGKALKRLPAPSWANQPSSLFMPNSQTLIGSDWQLTQVKLWWWKEGKETILRVPRRAGPNGSDSSSHYCASADGKFLAIGPQSRQPLGIWDVATGTQLCAIDAQASVSFFSPDGQVLAVASMPQGAGGVSVLRLYEVPTGKELKQIALSGKGFYWWLAFSPDAKRIAAVDTEGISLLDLQTGRELHRIGGSGTGRQRIAFFSPDGRVLASTAVGRIHLWDTATGKELHERPGNPDQLHGAAYTADGRLLATGGWVEPTLVLWDPATGRRVRLLEPHWHLQQDAYVRYLQFSADARTLVVGRHPGELAFVDAVSGQVRRSLVLPNVRPVKPQWAEFHHFHLTPDGRHAVSAERVFTPRDSSQVTIWNMEPVQEVASHNFPSLPRRSWASLGEQAAFLTPEGVRIADAGTGQFRLLVPGAWSAPLVASPNAKLLAAYPKQQDKSPKETICVWEAATGKEVAKLPIGRVEHLALSPDGRTLVTADAAALRVWDLASGKQRHTIAFPEDFRAASGEIVNGLYLSPDGQQATTALEDCALLVWALPPRPRPVAAPLTPEEANRMWNDLAGEDATRAYAAIWKLADSPLAAVALLGKQLQPAAPVDAEKARRHLRDLDSDDFGVREAASRALEQLGPRAVTALHQALKDNPSAEARRRIETVLATLSSNPLSQDTLRRLRAIQALAQIGSPESRQILEAMARGEPAAPETRDAKAALAK
jgi:RNA polymerase sigma factor (sigma-70 family)